MYRTLLVILLTMTAACNGDGRGGVETTVLPTSPPTSGPSVPDVAAYCEVAIPNVHGTGLDVHELGAMMRAARQYLTEEDIDRLEAGWHEFRAARNAASPDEVGAPGGTYTTEPVVRVVSEICGVELGSKTYVVN